MTPVARVAGTVWLKRNWQLRENPFRPAVLPAWAGKIRARMECSTTTR